MNRKVKVYRADVRIYGTLYVKAYTKKQAEGIARNMKGWGFEVSNGNNMIPISGLSYDNVHLPAVSLSPAMTLDVLEEPMGNAGE